MCVKHKQKVKMKRLAAVIVTSIIATVLTITVYKNFEPKNKMIYRVDADPFWQQYKPLEPSLGKWNRKYWLNRLRRK